VLKRLLSCQHCSIAHLSAGCDRIPLDVRSRMLFIWPDISDHLGAFVCDLGPSPKLPPELDILVVDLHDYKLDVAHLNLQTLTCNLQRQQGSCNKGHKAPLSAQSRPRLPAKREQCATKPSISDLQRQRDAIYVVQADTRLIITVAMPRRTWQSPAWSSASHRQAPFTATESNNPFIRVPMLG
jgi:hypothetical protein